MYKVHIADMRMSTPARESSRRRGSGCSRAALILSRAQHSNCRWIYGISAMIYAQVTAITGRRGRQADCASAELVEARPS